MSLLKCGLLLFFSRVQDLRFRSGSPEHDVTGGRDRDGKGTEKW